MYHEKGKCCSSSYYIVQQVNTVNKMTQVIYLACLAVEKKFKDPYNADQ